MNTIKHTAGWTLARFRAWRSDLRGGRDMARRYDLLARLTRIDINRRRFPRHDLPRAALI